MTLQRWRRRADPGHVLEDPQLSLFEGRPVSPERPCSSRVWLKCRGCGRLETRSLSCAVPCRACPWGTHRVASVAARLPRVPLRHWVLVPPPRWARALGVDAQLAQRFRRAAVARIVGLVEQRARAELKHGRGKAGALAVLHAVGADLLPRAHVHLVVTDGVFVPAARGAASFVPLRGGLGEDALRGLARVVAADLREALPDPPFARASPPDTRVPGAPPEARRAGTRVSAGGTNVFVGARIAQEDRAAAERLAAYVTRPPLAAGAIRDVGAGQVELALREPASDGAVALQLPRLELEARIAAMVRTGVSRRMSAHGVLAAGSAVRWRGDGAQLPLLDAPRVVARRPGGERCTCGGRLEVVTAEPLEQAGVPTTASSRRPAGMFPKPARRAPRR